ncbi:MAG: hypothetical protein LBI28_09660 [Treponema sp.]|jgi:hypothetical protein|nr:hypothetical protein [Treponema sp.]
MKSTWYIIWTEHEDYHRYLDDDVFRKHYCQNPKCNRLLTPCPEQNNLSKIKKLKADFVILSSMNLYLCSDKFLSVITSYAKDDVSFKAVNPNVNILQVNSTCALRDELIDESPPCPECGITLSRTIGRACVGNRLNIFKNPDNESSLICRSKITVRDSYYAHYLFFVRDALATELKKIKCIGLQECINET